MAPNPADRRTEQRLPANVSAEFKVAGHIGKAITVDISEGGLFLNTNEKAELGERVFLRLLPGPGEPEIRVVGAVRRVVKPGEGPLPGLGIQFETLFSPNKEKLERFLAELLGEKDVKQTITVSENAQYSKYEFKKTEPKAPPPKPSAKAPAPKKKATDKELLAEFDFTATTQYTLKRVPWRIIVLTGLVIGIVLGLGKALDFLMGTPAK
ncbi:MAG: PilZ domain-containing protein [Bdellovibrionota bacterium]